MNPNIINPIVFAYQICPNCKQIDTLTYIDQYKHKTSNPIYPATGLICTNCGKEYPIFWKNIEGEQKPFPGSKEKEKETIDEMIKFSLENVRKLD